VSETPLDPREHPFRADLAASYLKDKVDAERFCDGERLRVTSGVLDVRARPDAGAMRTSQLLFGEDFTVYDRAGGWAWGQCQVDGYVGYVPADGLGPADAPADHEVTALRTYAFEGPDLKTEPVATLHLSTRVRVLDRDGRFCRTDAGGWVVEQHLAALGNPATDPLDVAWMFAGAPYLWGGRSSLGLDCSALVQLALARCGRSVPRDSDQQERSVGNAVDGGVEAARTGDLLYMKGHVVIVSGPGRILHANAHHMAVAEEPLEAFLDRIAAMDLSITTVRRP